MRPGRPVVVSDPVPPRSVIDEAERDRRRPAAHRPRLQLFGRSPSMELGGARAALQRAALSGAARRQPAAQRVRRAGGVRGAARAACRSTRRRCATASLSWRVAGPLPGRAGPADAGARRRAQPACGRRAGAEPRPDGLSSADARGVRRDARQGPGRDPRAHGTSRRSLALHRPAHAARRQRRGVGCVACRASASRVPGRSPSRCHASPAEALTAALAGADPADRIVVFGSFYTVGGVLEDGLPRLSGQHAA